MQPLYESNITELVQSLGWSRVVTKCTQEPSHRCFQPIPSAIPPHSFNYFAHSISFCELPSWPYSKLDKVLLGTYFDCSTNAHHLSFNLSSHLSFNLSSSLLCFMSSLSPLISPLLLIHGDSDAEVAFQVNEQVSE